jgi:hypothetical protein
VNIGSHSNARSTIFFESGALHLLVIPLSDPTSFLLLLGNTPSISPSRDVCAHCASGGDGAFTIRLKPRQAVVMATGINITVSSGGHSVTITDVLFGDVWVRQGSLFCAMLTTLGVSSIPATRPRYVLSTLPSKLQPCRPTDRRWYNQRGEWDEHLSEGRCGTSPMAV